VSDITLDQSDLNTHVNAVMSSLSRGQQAVLARKISRALINQTKEDHKSQRNPDGSKWQARKQQTGKPRNRRKMYVRMRLAKHLKIRNQRGQAIIGWRGPVARVARISQHGLKDRNNHDAKYPERRLIGINADTTNTINQVINDFISGEGD